MPGTKIQTQYGIRYFEHSIFIPNRSRCARIYYGALPSHDAKYLARIYQTHDKAATVRQLKRTHPRMRGKQPPIHGRDLYIVMPAICESHTTAGRRVGI